MLGAAQPHSQHHSTDSNTHVASNGRRASLFVDESDPIFLPQPRRSSSRDNTGYSIEPAVQSYHRSPIDGSDRSASTRQTLASPGSSPASGDSQRLSVDMGSFNRVSSPSTSGDVSPAGLKIDTTWAPMRTAVAQREASQSPHPIDLQDARRPPGRTGALALATMHEEVDYAAHDRGPLPSTRPGHLSSEPESQFRPSRHRSSSSAAALALHGTGPAFADRWASNTSGRIATATPASRSVWDRDITQSDANHPGAGRVHPHLQRGFSASYVGPSTVNISPSPFLSSPGAMYEAAMDYASHQPLSASHSSFSAASSSFAPSSDLSDKYLHRETDLDAFHKVHTGYDSRRHSVAGPHPDQGTGTIGDPRRALGFAVDPSHKLHASSDAFGRRETRRTFSSFSGNGGSAFSADDLGGGSSRPTLSDGQDEARRNDGSQHRDMPALPVRVPLDRSSQSSVYAASMPSDLSEGASMNYPLGSTGVAQNFARPQGMVVASRDGQDSLSASWDTKPSALHQPGRTGHEAYQKLADVSRQLQQMSIGATDVGHDHRQARRQSFVFEEPQEGTHTVRASPGASPAGLRRDNGQSAMSAQAKSFKTMPPSSTDYSNVIKAVRQTAYSTVPQPLPPGNVMSAALPLSPANVQQADTAFSSLAALGPLPPSSVGPAAFASTAQGDLQDLGKGVALAALPKDTLLYIVEFKQGRTDLFFHTKTQAQEVIQRGDLVIVEADRGKDLGTVVNASITVEQVQSFLAHQSDLAMGAGMRAATEAGLDEACATVSGLSIAGGAGAISRPMRSINPKRLFSKATAANTSTLYAKAQDEERALQLCTAKVAQRGLPMAVIAAEMQWDRRKLTFYYTASMRVDFRDLVKELFRLYKTRIWMCHLGHPSGTGMG